MAINPLRASYDSASGEGPAALAGIPATRTKLVRVTLE